MSLTTLRRRTADACARLHALESEIEALHDPRAIEHAAIAGVSIVHLTERLDELLEESANERRGIDA